MKTFAIVLFSEILVAAMYAVLYLFAVSDIVWQAAIAAVLAVVMFLLQQRKEAMDKARAEALALKVEEVKQKAAEAALRVEEVKQKAAEAALRVEEVKQKAAETAKTTTAELTKISETADATHRIVNSQRTEMRNEISELKGQVASMNQANAVREAREQSDAEPSS